MRLRLLRCVNELPKLGSACTGRRQCPYPWRVSVAQRNRVSLILFFAIGGRADHSKTLRPEHAHLGATEFGFQFHESDFNAQPSESLHRRVDLLFRQLLGFSRKKGDLHSDSFLAQLDIPKFVAYFSHEIQRVRDALFYRNSLLISFRQSCFGEFLKSVAWEFSTSTSFLVDRFEIALRPRAWFGKLLCKAKSRPQPVLDATK